MSNTARDERQDASACEFSDITDSEKAVAGGETRSSSTRGNLRHVARRKARPSAEFQSTFPSVTTAQDVEQLSDISPQQSVNSPLCGMIKIVDEVIEARQGQNDWETERENLLQTSERNSVSRQFGKVELFSLDPDESRLAVVQTRDASQPPELKCHQSIGQEEFPSTDSLPPAIQELLERVLGSPVLVCMSHEQLPTMLWTPETHRTILDSFNVLEATTDGLGSGVDRNIIPTFSRSSSERTVGESAPKQEPFTEKTDSVPPKRALEEGLIVDLVTAFKHYRHSEVGKGDAAVERALAAVVGSQTGEPDSVLIRPLILAGSLNSIVSREESLSTNSPDPIQDTSAPHLPLELLAMNQDIRAMDSSQISDLVALAENAALKAADQVLTGAGMFLIKPEVTESLAAGLQQLARSTIENRSAGISQASLDMVANATARDGCRSSLASLLGSCLRDGIESEARQSIKSTLQEQPVRAEQSSGTPMTSSMDTASMLGSEMTWGRLSETDKIDDTQTQDAKPEFGAAGHAGPDRSQPEVDRLHECTDKEALPAGLSSDSVKEASDESRGFPASFSRTAPIEDKPKVEQDWGPVIPLPLGLDVWGGGIPRRLSPAGAAQSGRGFTLKMVARSVRGLSRVAELLLSMITHRGTIASLRASCNALKTGAPDLETHGPFSVRLEGLGKGETAFVVFAENEREAMVIQEHLSSLLNSPTKAPASLGKTKRAPQ